MTPLYLKNKGFDRDTKRPTKTVLVYKVPGKPNLSLKVGQYSPASSTLRDELWAHEDGWTACMVARLQFTHYRVFEFLFTSDGFYKVGETHMEKRRLFTKRSNRLAELYFYDF